MFAANYPAFICNVYVVEPRVEITVLDCNQIARLSFRSFRAVSSNTFVLDCVFDL